MITRAALPRIGLLLVLVALVAWAFLHPPLADAASLQQQIQSLGPWGPAAFVALFALATLAFLPGAVFGLAGGALFGPAWGTLWNLIGAALGATLAFVAARYIGRDYVARCAGGRLKALVGGVEAEGWRFVAFVRLVPLFPFNLLNYALGLTRIRADHYVLASALAMAPGTLAYTWLGYAGTEVAAGSQTAVRTVLFALAPLAAAAFLRRLLRRFRQPQAAWIDADRLMHQLQREPGLLVIDVRGADEFNGPLGHIRSARNIPLAEMAARRAELQGWKTRGLTLVCRTDKRSAKAAALLAEAGFANVRILRGGMEAWKRQDLPSAPDAGLPVKGVDNREDVVHPQ
jgi:uncharacterized membrane protein YdjX (TVP38/TMEM64 family)/rhodanese-related sulfurtransferase